MHRFIYFCKIGSNFVNHLVAERHDEHILKLNFLMKIFLQNHYTLKIVLISSTAKNNQIYSKFQISFMNHDSASFYNYKILLHPSKQYRGILHPVRSSVCR